METIIKNLDQIMKQLKKGSPQFAYLIAEEIKQGIYYYPTVTGLYIPNQSIINCKDRDQLTREMKEDFLITISENADSILNNTNGIISGSVLYCAKFDVRDRFYITHPLNTYKKKGDVQILFNDKNEMVIRH